jgi:hypothetical protein
MKKHLSIAASAIALLVPTAIGYASPAEAAQSFKMPSINGMNLQEAEDAVEAAAGGAPLAMESHNISGMKQKQLSLTDWLVCNQKPVAGEPFTVGTKIDFGVVREFDAARNVHDAQVAEACD